MANKNQQTAEQAAAKSGAAAQSTPPPPAGDASQQPDANQPQQPEGEAETQEQAAQIEQLKTELQAVTTERDELKATHEAALEVVPLFHEPYIALGEEQFNTVLEIVLGEAHERGIVTTPEAETEPAEQAATEQPAEEPTQEEQVKDLLQRMGLKQAWLTPEGQPAFDEKHLRHFYGEDVFNSLTVISAE